MQDNFSEWPIYIHFIAYNENYLFLRENNLSLCLKYAISYFVMWHDCQNGGFRSYDLYKICGKMFAS